MSGARCESNCTAPAPNPSPEASGFGHVGYGRSVPSYLDLSHFTQVLYGRLIDCRRIQRGKCGRSRKRVICLTMRPSCIAQQVRPLFLRDEELRYRVNDRTGNYPSSKSSSSTLYLSQWGYILMPAGTYHSSDSLRTGAYAENVYVLPTNRPGLNT